jgi:dimethylglycine catabolism A
MDADAPRTKDRVQRVPLPDARWPDRAEAAASLLFSRGRIGSVETRTRTWVPAMVPWRASDDGLVTPDVLDWYGRFADGRPGVLVVEATGVRDVPSGPLLRIGDDRFVPGLRELVRVVKERSSGATRLLIQCIDFLAIRRRPERAKYLSRFLEIRSHHRDGLERAGAVEAARGDDAAVRAALERLDDDTLLAILTPREREDLLFGHRERVTDTHLAHVRDLPLVLPDLFASAAERARRAGFDGVELHYAHAYTMASFLSRTNTRADGYGSTLEGRLRLPLEVLARVRERVGADYTVGCRYLGDEVIAGGSRVEDAVAQGVAFAAAGMDFLSLSKGGKFDDAKQPKVGEAAYPYTGESGHECMPTVRIAGGPFGRNLHLARAVRDAVRGAGHATPVVAAGGIATYEQAEGALRSGACDFVASARQSLADPDWWRKVELGRGDAVRRCLFTNYCEGLDQRHLEVTCQLWDREFDEPDAGGSAPRNRSRRSSAAPWRRRSRSASVGTRRRVESWCARGMRSRARSNSPHRDARSSSSPGTTHRSRSASTAARPDLRWAEAASHSGPSSSAGVRARGSSPGPRTRSSSRGTTRWDRSGSRTSRSRRASARR